MAKRPPLPPAPEGSFRGPHTKWTASRYLRLWAEVALMQVRNPALSDRSACENLAAKFGLQTHLLQKRLIDARKYHADSIFAETINEKEDPETRERLLTKLLSNR